MKIKLIAVGKSMPDWVSEGFNEYCKRLPNSIQLELFEIPLNKRLKNADVARLIADEARQTLQHIHSQDHVIALDIPGKNWSTVQLAQNLQRWQNDGHTVCMLIGGPEGLAHESLQRANESWSLSNLTLPHPLVRIILAEQIYRATTILAGHPYHK